MAFKHIFLFDNLFNFLMILILNIIKIIIMCYIYIYNDFTYNLNYFLI